MNGELCLSSSFVSMNKYAIHTNLNTSFVNLSALVRHLRDLQFTGSIQIELSSYEAEIEFSGDGSINAREQDHIAGRMSFGRDALQRIMIRSREAGGVVHVYKKTAIKSSENVFIDDVIATRARQMAPGTATGHMMSNQVEDLFAFTAIAEPPIPKPGNVFEAEPADNWTELLALISELINTVDESLEKGNISFDELFRNACGFASFDHPFLDPDSDVFAYDAGYISVRQRLATREIINGIIAALSRIMQRLREDPYFGNVYHQTMHRVRVLANRRKLQFEMYGLNSELQKIIGI